MTAVGAGAAANNPTVRTEPRELVELRARLNDVVDHCVQNMALTGDGGLVNSAGTRPSEVLDRLGVDYGPGSDLAESVKNKER